MMKLDKDILEQFGIKFLRLTNDKVFENLDNAFNKTEHFISDK